MVDTVVKSEAVGIMLDLDALLDTRHGTLKKLYPDLFPKLRNSAKYYLRKVDRWDFVESELNDAQIQLAYQGRDIETLKNSQLTMVIRVLISTIADIVDQIKGNDPGASSFYFILNVYPYNLTVDLVKEIASKFLIQIGYENAPIGFINQPWKTITPEFLKENSVKHWFCYHYEEWLRECFEPIKANEEVKAEHIVGAPNTKMYVPMLVRDQEAIEEFVNDLRENTSVDHFALTHAIFRNIINLEFLPISTFCTIDIEKLKLLEGVDKMEKSEILSIPQKAVKEVLERGGVQLPVSSKLANVYLDSISELAQSLKQHNNRENIVIFKTNLAELLLTVLKLYNTTPFDSGEDLEALINGLSLQVDATEEEYLETERFWNGQGIKTIKRIVTLESGEQVYRCVAAEGQPPMINEGDILKPMPVEPLTVRPVDFVSLEGYL